MPIDLAQVDWFYVVLLAVFAFVATYIGNLLSFGRHGIGAVLSAVLFAVIFVAWTYYPHHLPLPTALATQKAPAAAVGPAAPAAPAAPQRPRNPITDITPPATTQQ
jgi:1,4-dihydroxy-2-naphthoate octaprenyltransferase